MREWSVSELLDAVAAKTAAPGGGSAAAYACALAAGLVEMAARFAPAELGPSGARAAELRARSLNLAEAELSAYEPVLEALRLPRQDPVRESRIRRARSGAADSPLALAEVAAEVSELAAQAVGGGSRPLAGDALTAALLAEAACRAAAGLVEINLAEEPEDPRRIEAAKLARRARSAREKALPSG